MELVTLVGNVAVMMGICTFASGISICKNIWHKKSTADLSAFPFIAGVICTSLWLNYGLYVHDGTMITVNGVGLSLQAVYLIFFYAMTINKKMVRKQILSLLIGLGVYSFAMSKNEDPKYWTGLLSCGASLLFCAAPLVSLAEVLKTKSTENLPLPLLMFTFLGQFLWFTYGILVSDRFVQIPNAIGASLCAAQLALFVIYPSTPGSKKKQLAEDQKALVDYSRDYDDV